MFYHLRLPALLVVYIRGNLPESDIWLERRKISGVPPQTQLITDFFGRFVGLFAPETRTMFLKSLVLTTFGLTAYWLTYSWMPGYLYQQRHFTLTKSALWILVTQAGGFCGYLSFGFFADRFGRRPAYSLFAVMMGLGLAMITIFWDDVARYPAVILGFMFLVGFGTGFFSGYGPIFSELFPTEIRSTAMGTAFNLARGAQFFTPVAIATIATGYGLGGGISLAVLFAALSAIWIWTLPETKGKKLEV